MKLKIAMLIVVALICTGCPETMERAAVAATPEPVSEADQTDEVCKELVRGALSEPLTAKFAPREVEAKLGQFDETWKYTVESRVFGRLRDQYFYCGVNHGNGKVTVLAWP